MRKFLLLVVVLAAIGLVSCANNAGGGSGSDGGNGTDIQKGFSEEDILTLLEGTWETKGYSAGEYQKLYNHGNPNEYVEYAFQYIFTSDLKSITLTKEQMENVRTETGGKLLEIQNMKFGDTNWENYSSDKYTTHCSIFYHKFAFQDENYIINLKTNNNDREDHSKLKISGNKLYIPDLEGKYTILLEKVK